MIRFGIDFGGTKIEAAAIYPNGRFAARQRMPNPGDYEASLKTIASLVDELETSIRQPVEHIGVGMPGSVSPATGLMKRHQTEQAALVADALGHSVRTEIRRTRKG